MFTAPIVGAAFGFGWSPCLGPVIAAVFGVAATQTSARAVALLAAYSLGMGVSFLAVGLAFGASAGAARLPQRHLRTITLVSAALLVRLRRAPDVGPAVAGSPASSPISSTRSA